MEWLGGAGAGGDNALYYYVKCDHCDEVVRLRIGRGSDLTQEYGRQRATQSAVIALTRKWSGQSAFAGNRSR